MYYTTPFFIGKIVLYVILKH
ncbi:hypothetical protein ACQ27_gp194 [Klebsiella phage K64-1]|nr:hypothetical protein ACQ27_gp194 [Klebsiella phage K64-1]